MLKISGPSASPADASSAVVEGASSDVAESAVAIGGASCTNPTSAGSGSAIDSSAVPQAGVSPSGWGQASGPSGPDPVAISPDSVGKTISAAWFIGKGNDLALDTISFYRPNQPDAYPIVLATYEIVCSKYPDPQVGTVVKAFLQSTIGAGQDGLADNGYVPIPQEFRSRLSTGVDAVS